MSGSVEWAFILPIRTEFVRNFCVNSVVLYYRPKGRSICMRH